MPYEGVDPAHCDVINSMPVTVFRLLEPFDHRASIL